MNRKEIKSTIDRMDQSIDGFPDQLDNNGNVLGLFLSGSGPTTEKKNVNLALSKVRAAKKALRETLSDILNSEDDEGNSYMELMLSALVLKSISGDVKAAELVSKILGEATDAKIDIKLPEIRILTSQDTTGIRYTEDPGDLEDEMDSRK